MLAAGLALAASLAWGFGDFLGGFKSRTVPGLTVALVAQVVGCAGLGIVLAARAEGPPGAGSLL